MNEEGVMKKAVCEYKQLLGLLAGGVLCSVLSSCKMASKLNSTSSCSAFGVCLDNPAAETPVGDGSPGPTLTNESPFKVTLKSYWDDDIENEFPTSYDLELMNPATKDTDDLETTSTGLSCEIPVGANPVGASDFSDPSAIGLVTNINSYNYYKAMRTCLVEIPETQLYMSKIEFTVETKANHQCDVIRTYPNYYLASRSKEFSPPWDPGQKIDCEDNGNFTFPQNKECYNGAAKQLIDGFPISTHISESISNKGPKYLKKWLIDSGREAMNGNYGAGNTWLGFQKDRLFRYPSWGITLVDSKFLADSENFAGNLVGNSHTWHFQCVQTGSNLAYQYEIRIIPKPDANLNPGAYRPSSWDNWNAKKPTAVDSLDITQGPIDGNFEIVLQNNIAEPFDKISAGDAIYICKKETSPKDHQCNDDTPPLEPRYFCEIDPEDTGNNHVCKMPQLNSVAEAGTYLLWHAKSNTLIQKAEEEFEYKALSLTGVTGTSGPGSGGTEITLTGAGFALDAKVTIGDKNCPIIADSLNTNFTEVKCTTPGETLAAGVGTLTKAIKISNPTSEQEVTFGTAFTYFKPVITSVSTGTCEEESACSVTVNGTFNTAGNSYLVTVDGQDCEGVSNTGTELTCSFTPEDGSAGQKDIVVTDQYDQSATKTGAVTVTAPAPPPAP